LFVYFFLDTSERLDTERLELAFKRMLLKLGTGNGERGNGKRGTGNGKRETGNGERETGNGERETGNGERETENGKGDTGNGKRGTVNRERESGNECTPETRLRLQHGGQRKRKGNNLGKYEEVLRV